ncbi:MAG: acyltransferase [Armatimonadota bacterium]
MTANATDTPPLKALTGLRILVALRVVFHHYATPLFVGWPAPLAAVVNNEFIGVSTFFVLSGFVLAYAYGNPERGLLRREDFWVNRLARVYPVYLLGFVLIAPLELWNNVQVNGLVRGLEQSAMTGSLAALLLHAWTPWTMYSWNFPSWSISVEAFFYLLFPLLLPWLARQSTPRLLGGLGLAWLAGLLVPLLAVLFYLHHPLGPSAWIAVVGALRGLPLLRLPEFVFGLIAGLLFLRRVHWPRSLRWTLRPWVPYAAGLGLWLGLSLPTEPWRPVWENGFLAPLMALLFTGLAGAPSLLASGLSTPVLVLLGESSYAVFILQAPVADWMRLALGEMGLGSAFRGVSFTDGRLFALYLLLLLGLSLLTSRRLEQPLRRVLRQRLRAAVSSVSAEGARPGARQP